jgi:uncharacterized protein (DUF58 family)
MTTGQKVLLVLLALSLIAGLSTGGVLYYRLSILWALLLAIAWAWSALSLRGVKFSRSARTVRAQVGQIFEERFDIQNPSILPRLWLEVLDSSTLPGTDGSRVVTMILGKQTRSYLARTRLLKRGVFPLGPTDISSGDIFGLFPVKISLPAKDTLLVYPMMVDVRNFPNPPGLLPGGEALRRRTHQITPNAAGIREYEPGDPLNRIHWLSTARRGRMMVKEFELDPLADVWIFMDAEKAIQQANPQAEPDYYAKDFWQRHAKIALPPSTEEYGISIAASLARDYLRRGRAVGLVGAGQQLILIAPDRGGRQLGKILEALALLRAEGTIPLRGLVETQVKHMVRGSTIVLITPTVNKEAALLADYLLQRGLRPVVILLDAVTFGGSLSSEGLLSSIKMLGVPVRSVACGADLEQVLSNGNGRGV